MRPDRSSATAELVAWLRAVATAHPDLGRACRDPAAGALLDPRLGPLRRPSPRAARVLRHAAFGLVDHLALRTAGIDAALRGAAARGVAQVVTLGAGLDARAHRLPELAGARVIEVDHPATQAKKRARAARLGPGAAELVHAACDFGEVSLDEALTRAGHDAAAPTFWIWEGVTMYLPRRAVEATLDALAARSAAGSLLAMSYLTPERLRVSPRLGALAAFTLRFVSEPVLSSLTSADVVGLLAARGFRVVSDVLPRDTAHAAGVTSRPLFPLAPDERLVVAERLPGG